MTRTLFIDSGVLIVALARRSFSPLASRKAHRLNTNEGHGGRSLDTAPHLTICRLSCNTIEKPGPSFLLL